MVGHESAGRRAVRRAVRVLLGPRGLLAAVVAGLLLRLVAIALVDADGVNLHEFGTIGHNLVGGHGYSYHAVAPDGRIQTDGSRGDGSLLTGPRLPSAFLPPAYTAVVAVAISLTDSHAATVQLLQLVNLMVAAAATVVVHRLGSLLGGRPAGVGAAWVFALYPPLVFAATQASAVNLYLPVQLLAVLCLVEAAVRRGVRATVTAGLALGVLCLFRSEAVVLVPAAALWLLLTRRHLRRGRVLVATGLLVAVAVAVPSVWIARNTVVFDRPVLTITTSGGFNLWIGNHDGATGSQKWYETPPDTEAAVRAVPVTPAYEVDVDRVYLGEALRSAADQPVATLVRGAVKLAMMLGADPYDPRSLHPLYLGSWALLLALGVAGLIAARGRRPVRRLLIGLLAVSLVVPVVFFALARHRLGVEVVLVVLAGAVVARYAARFAARPGPPAPAVTAPSPGRPDAAPVVRR
jgi:4-amino-4-deoxy-L-arabinose transferase-like glycosyltransferase